MAFISGEQWPDVEGNMGTKSNIMEQGTFNILEVHFKTFPVCWMNLYAVALSPYDLGCWWDVKHKHKQKELTL